MYELRTLFTLLMLPQYQRQFLEITCDYCQLMIIENILGIRGVSVRLKEAAGACSTLYPHLSW